MASHPLERPHPAPICSGASPMMRSRKAPDAKHPASPKPATSTTTPSKTGLIQCHRILAFGKCGFARNDGEFPWAPSVESMASAGLADSNGRPFPPRSGARNSTMLDVSGATHQKFPIAAGGYFCVRERFTETSPRKNTENHQVLF